VTKTTDSCTLGEDDVAEWPDDIPWPDDLVAEHMFILAHGAPPEPDRRLRDPFEVRRPQVHAAERRLRAPVPPKSKPVTVSARMSQSRGRRETRTAAATLRAAPACDGGPPSQGDGPERRPTAESPVILSKEKYELVTDALAELILGCIERRMVATGERRS
jgi:hypothetical protein